MGSGGTNGATHTIIVAPTKGVLRMVPFATEAAVGDTIEFIWHADQHTVTKGSALQLCNQSADASTFDTGLQNHSFSYLQVVNDTNPLYYYCAHPGHCQNGMFGVINPLTTDDPALQAGSAQNETMGDSTMAAMAYTQGAIANGTSADANNLAKVWGAKYSLKDIPAEMHGAFMENMLYVRSLIAMNPDLVQDGKLKMSTAGAPVMWPMDVAGASAVAAKAQLAVAPGAAPAGAAAAAPASSSDAAPAATTTAAKKNGARGLAASGVTVALGLFVSFLAL
jgi:plastocyanin